MNFFYIIIKGHFLIMKKILKLKPMSNELKEYYSINSKHFADDAGYDLFIPRDITISPKETFFIDHEVQCEVIEQLPNYQKNYLVMMSINSSYFLVPRSSISKRNLIMVNSIGIIDSGYRGNITAVVFNYSDSPVELKMGERLFQIIVPDLSPFDVELVDSLSQTERGDGGFGSTGK